MIIQIIKLKSGLSEEELLNVADERKPGFEAIPGLVQKYYFKTGEEGGYGGVYIWDSKESLMEYRQSELAATIPQAYQLVEAPDIEVLDVLFQLRE